MTPVSYTHLLYRSTIEDKINALRPYIEAADTFNLNSVAYTYQIQPTLEELRNHTHNTSVTLPDYKKLKAQLEAAKEESSTQMCIRDRTGIDQGRRYTNDSINKQMQRPIKYDLTFS